MEKGDKLNENERNVHGTTHDKKCRCENHGKYNLCE